MTCDISTDNKTEKLEIVGHILNTVKWNPQGMRKKNNPPGNSNLSAIPHLQHRDNNIVNGILSLNQNKKFLMSSDLFTI